MAIGDANDVERLEIAARQSKTAGVADASGQVNDPRDAAHFVRTAMDRCRHPITGVLVGVSK